MVYKTILNHYYLSISRLSFKSRAFNHILYWFYRRCFLYLMRRIKVFVCSGTLQSWFIWLIVISFYWRWRIISFFWRILSTISSLSLKLSCVRFKSFIFIIVNSLSQMFFRNITFVIFCLCFYLNFWWLIFIVWFETTFWLFTNFMRRIMRFITSLNYLRIIMCCLSTLIFFISLLRCCYIIRFIIIIIGGLCLKFVAFLWTFMLAYILLFVPHTHI